MSNGISAKAIRYMENTFERLQFLGYSSTIKRDEFLCLNEAESHSQYVKFNKLCAYLLQSINSKEEVVPFEVEEFEDPSITAQKLMVSLRSVDDFEIDFPISELKRAYGDAACKILEFLSVKSVAYQSLPEVKYLPHLPSDEVDEESKVKEAGMKKREASTEKYKEWYEEVDRVSPLLEVDFESIRNKTNEGNHSIMQNANAFISDYETSKHLLVRLKEESETKLEQMNSNEAAVQTIFDKLIRDYTIVDKQVSLLEEERENVLKDYEKSKADSKQLSAKLQKLNAAVEEKGNSITDTSQIMKLKATLQQMKTEIRKQDFELGVLQHTLLQKNLCLV